MVISLYNAISLIERSYSCLAGKCSIRLSRAIYVTDESERNHTFAVIPSFTPCSDQWADFITMKKYLGLYIQFAISTVLKAYCYADFGDYFGH